MGENSNIEWTHHTFNPWTGCTAVSPACDNCYAESWAKRSGHVKWGPHGARRLTKTWGNPIKWNKQAVDATERPRVFCASLADVFDNHRSIEPKWRTDLWQLVENTPNLDWLLLTKRPQNIRRQCPWSFGTYPPNVWLGTTAEDQTEADRRIWHLCQTPSRVRFLSLEPLVGPIDLTKLKTTAPGETFNCLTGEIHNPKTGEPDSLTLQIDWVIIGGENAHKPREMQADWVRSIIEQCARNATPVLFKQWHGKNRAEIKSKGRAIDGIIHDGYPDAEILDVC